MPYKATIWRCTTCGAQTTVSSPRPTTTKPAICGGCGGTRLTKVT